MVLSVRRMLCVASLWLVSSVGCDQGVKSPDDTWGGTIDTLDTGTLLVRNDGRPLWSDGSGWELTEDLRIGSMMESGPTAFGRIHDLQVDSAGRIYILDGQAQEVRVFFADGTYSHKIGRQGEGPGELKQAVAMGWGPGSVLRVVDMGNARISSFEKDGTFVSGAPQTGGFSMFPWPGAFLHSGGVVTVASHIGDDGFEPILIRLDAHLAPSDTLPMPRFQGDATFFELTDGDRRMRASVPYGEGLAWDLDPRGYIWVAPNTTDYEINQVTFSGDTLLRVRQVFEPVQIAPAEIDSAISQMSWFTDQGGRIDRSKFPAVKPALQRISVSETGHLLITPLTAEFGSGWSATPKALDVFEPAGRYLGRLDLPAGFQSASPQPRFVDDYVYAVVLDELDVPFVVRYRLEAGG
jgi:hypothetical protein